jgi:hypothetical protein
MPSSAFCTSNGSRHLAGAAAAPARAADRERRARGQGQHARDRPELDEGVQGRSEPGQVSAARRRMPSVRYVQRLALLERLPAAHEVVCLRIAQGDGDAGERQPGAQHARVNMRAPHRAIFSCA